jgi:hypothetical protein
MNFKTKIALTCSLSASLVLVGSLTPTIAYAIQNTKNTKDDPEIDDYNYTDADVVDTKTNVLVNYDRYPVSKEIQIKEETNITEKVNGIVSSTELTNKAKVYALLEIGSSLNLNLIN